MTTLNLGNQEKKDLKFIAQKETGHASMIGGVRWLINNYNKSRENESR